MMTVFSIVKKFSSPSREYTQKLAAQLVDAFVAPVVFCLNGDLGAGKTTFVQGAIEHLANGAKMRIQSPTFALAKSYATKIPVHHIDLYRIEDKASLVGLGIEELINDDGAFCFVEWPERYELSWPERTIWLNFSLESANQRIIELSLPASLKDTLFNF